MKILLFQNDYPDNESNFYPMTNEKNHISGTQLLLKKTN